MPIKPQIAPRIDENGEPVCSGEKCVSWRGDHCSHQERPGYPDDCLPALRRQRDEARVRAEKAETDAERLRGALSEIAHTGTSIPPAPGTGYDPDEAAWYRGLVFGMIRRAALAEKE